MLYKLLFIKIKKCVFICSVCFHGWLYSLKLSLHDQIWYHLIDNFMRNNFHEKYFTHTPFCFREKSDKLLKVTNMSPQNVVPQGVWSRAFYHMIRRLSSTLSCSKTSVINFFFFTHSFWLFAWAI